VKSTKEFIHAFIVRIWIEPQAAKDAEVIWRGVIEEVEGDERLYFDHLDKMSIYFAKYLKKIGIDVYNIRE
jgi:hypothetical protein